jgi:hypothetical protein
VTTARNAPSVASRSPSAAAAAADVTRLLWCAQMAVAASRQSSETVSVAASAR